MHTYLFSRASVRFENDRGDNGDEEEGSERSGLAHLQVRAATLPLSHWGLVLVPFLIPCVSPHTSSVISHTLQGIKKFKAAANFVRIQKRLEMTVELTQLEKVSSQYATYLHHGRSQYATYLHHGRSLQVNKTAEDLSYGGTHFFIWQLARMQWIL